MGEETLRILRDQVVDIQNYLAKDLVYREVHEKEIKDNANYSRKLNERLELIADRLSKQPTERLRLFKQYNDDIYDTLRKDKEVFDEQLRKDRMRFNDFQNDLVEEHSKIKIEVKEDIEGKLLSNIQTAGKIVKIAIAIIGAFISVTFTISLFVLDDIKTDIGSVEDNVERLEQIVIFGKDFKVEEKEKTK